MASCGLRVSEVFGLGLMDVDFERGVLKVRGQMVDGQLDLTKTDAGARVVPLVPSLLERLRRHVDEVPPSDGLLLFPTENGYPVRVENWRRRVWNPAVKASGLGQERRLTPHDLRRTFASAQALHGRSPAYLQSVMGHTKATTTLSYYVGIYGVEQVAAVKDMEDWLAREEVSRPGVLRVAC